MDAVVGEHVWNDPVWVQVPCELDGPASVFSRATKPVWSWMPEAIQSLALDEAKPWDWHTCADCGYGDSGWDECRVHKLVYKLANGQKQRLNPQFGLPKPMQPTRWSISPFDAHNAGYRYPTYATVRCPCDYEMMPVVMIGWPHKYKRY